MMGKAYGKEGERDERYSTGREKRGKGKEEKNMRKGRKEIKVKGREKGIK